MAKRNTEDTTHHDVQWLNIRIPIYTGDVNLTRPDFIDRRTVFLDVAQREGVQRVHEGFNRIAGVHPPRHLADVSGGGVARALFTAIAEAFQAGKTELTFESHD